MKKILLLMSCCLGLILHVSAQENILLQPSFWQAQPTVEQVKAEIAKGANPSEFNSRSFDPVVFAINAKAPIETIKYLLEQPGNSVKKLTHDSRIYLHWAAMRGDIDLVSFLLKNGSDISLKDSHGTSPFNFAANGGMQETKIYDLFLAKGENLKTDLNDDGANALLISIPNDKDFTLLKYFVSKGLSIQSKDAEGVNAFGYAAKGGNIDNMKALLKMGVSADPHSMVLATQGRNTIGGLEVYQYLESLKLDPKAAMPDGTNALHNLVKRPKQEKAINYFLSKNIDINQLDGSGNTVFMNAAASSSDIELLKKLKPNVKNINQQNKKGESALMLAVANNNAAVVDFLLQNSANIGLSDNAGNGLTYYLVEAYGRKPKVQGETKTLSSDLEEKLELLRTQNFDLAETPKNGNTLYHLAVLKGDLSLLKIIAPLNIDVNAKNAEGYTALHKAAMLLRNDEIMKYLISVGAKKEIKTGFDETAYDLAKENELLTKNNITLNFLK